MLQSDGQRGRDVAILAAAAVDSVPHAGNPESRNLSCQKHADSRRCQLIYEIRAVDSCEKQAPSHRDKGPAYMHLNLTRLSANKFRASPGAGRPGSNVPSHVLMLKNPAKLTSSGVSRAGFRRNIDEGQRIYR